MNAVQQMEISKYLYRVNFFFTLDKIDYSINYIREGKSVIQYRYTETIYQVSDGRAISRGFSCPGIPTADLALDNLTRTLHHIKDNS